MIKSKFLLVSVVTVASAFAQVPSGPVNIINLKSQTCLDMTGGTSAVQPGVGAQIWSCLGTSQTNQIFQLIAVSGGYEIESTDSGLALEANPNSTASSPQIVQEPFSSSNKAQIWTITAAATSGYYTLKPTSKTSSCMAAANGGTSNGTVVWLGGCNNLSQQEWKFVAVSNPATISGVSPSSGPTAGGTNVTISGTNFASGAIVTFGGAPATGVSVANADTILATTPVGNAGPVTVSVTNPGTAAVSKSDAFTYSASSGSGTISYVQGNSVGPQSPQNSVALAFPNAQTAGDLNIVVVGWNDSTATVSSVTDSLGNSYSLAVGPTVQSGTATQSIYYAPNVKAGSNSVVVQFSTAAAYPDIRILEYAGANTTSPIDVVTANSGNSTIASTNAVTTNYVDLLVAANLVQTTTSGPAAGFTQRLMTQPDGDIAEDEMTTQLGSYSASAPLTSAGPWIMQMLAVRPATGSTQPPPNHSVSLSWTASTTSGVSGYNVYRGASSTSMAQIASDITGISYTDTSVTAGATYYYAITAVASGQQSADSNIATATIP